MPKINWMDAVPVILFCINWSSDMLSLYARSDSYASALFEY